jgi:hypothetical protein
MKIFITGMQNFVSIRLFEVSWPPAVLSMFDFTRLFSFSIDVIRPECTIAYNPDSKLALLLIGPFTCVLVVALFMFVYTAFKCRRISPILLDPALQPLLFWPYWRVYESVGKCMLASALCLKFSATRIMSDGLLWNALNPALCQRSDMRVLGQKKRRLAVGRLDTKSNDKEVSRGIPEDWQELQRAFDSFPVVEEFAQSVKRFRLMVSSALSIFVFTFQGSMEAALSTFDCKNGYLRKTPSVECDLKSALYIRMVTISIFGIVIYSVVMPLCTVLLMRSRWTTEVQTHDSFAFTQLFGFLTSLYSDKYNIWELVACLRKVLFAAVPLLVTKDPLVQSFIIFSMMLVYMSSILYLRPMRSAYFNKLELLGCFSVLIGAFSSLFFTVEYKGQMLLRGATKDSV